LTKIIVGRYAMGNHSGLAEQNIPGNVLDHFYLTIGWFKIS
jgi:hypothetical protein